MNSASINEIKKELQHLNADALQAVCLRLAKYKKENKELLTYLLSDAQNEDGYIQNIKEELDAMFVEVNNRNLYIVKKILRKILRFANRQIKYSGLPKTELEIRLHFCSNIRKAEISLMAGTVLYNLYQQQVKRIFNVLEKLPEDYREDYAQPITELTV